MTSPQHHKILARTGVEVEFGQLTWPLYATDASIYKVTPLGVAYPKGSEQACAIVKATGDAGVTIILETGMVDE